jgi:ketosteroid isomerase-like protein
MSEENVEVVKRAAAAFNRADFGAVREFCDPDLVFYEPPEQPAPRVLRGWDAAYEAWTAFDEAWEDHPAR